MAIIDYENKEVVDQSFYQFIHAEDLNALSSCHQNRKCEMFYMCICIFIHNTMLYGLS